MEALLWLLLFQAPLGAFDIVYHHELTERLTWRPGAARELRLHGLRNGLYVIIFLSFGWFAWQGLLAWLFGLILLAEILVTLWDFLVEDRSRDLPPSERVTHTLLAIAYGGVLALFLPVWLDWAERPTGLALENRGWLGWVMTLFAAGCAFWAWRDSTRAGALARLARAARENPAEVLRLAVVKVGRTWRPWPSADEIPGFTIRFASAAGMVIVVVPALIGLWQHRRRGWEVWMLWAPAIYFTCLHAVFIGSMRYRLPAVLILTILAAPVWADWMNRIIGRRSGNAAAT